ncbi:unnamed protein product, partial [Discosporangium mesarthrocarpum]
MSRRGKLFSSPDSNRALRQQVVEKVGLQTDEGAGMALADANMERVTNVSAGPAVPAPQEPSVDLVELGEAKGESEGSLSSPILLSALDGARPSDEAAAAAAISDATSRALLKEIPPLVSSASLPDANKASDRVKGSLQVGPQDWESGKGEGTATTRVIGHSDCGPQGLEVRTVHISAEVGPKPTPVPVLQSDMDQSPGSGAFLASKPRDGEDDKDRGRSMGDLGIIALGEGREGRDRRFNGV